MAKKLKLSNILLLVLTGLLLGEFLPANGGLEFGTEFLVALAVLTLVMVVFDGAGRFELKMVNLLSIGALKLSLFFLLMNVVFITFFTNVLFFSPVSTESLLFSLLFAFVMTGTDPGSVFIMLKSKTNKVIEFLEVEAIINTPITVILPFIILDILNNMQTADVARAITSQLVPLLQQIVVGIGAGMVIGIIILKTMKRIYSQQYSPVALITSALLAYILAENLSGNGVLAVATLGLFFGNMYVKEKENLQEFNTMFNSALIILVFILIGMIVDIDFSIVTLLKALVLFAILILTRLVSLKATFKRSQIYKFNAKEQLFMALSMPKGIAAAVVAFSLSVFSVAPTLTPMLDTVLQLIIIMMVYSLICSSVIDRFSMKLIRIKIEEGK